MTISIPTILTIILIIFLAHVIQTITGFAGSMLAIPFLTLLISLDDAKVLITAIGLIWSFWILYTDHQFIDWRFLKFMIVLMIVGMLIGNWLANLVPNVLLMLLMGIIIIVSAVRNLLNKNSASSSNLIRDVGFGFGAGVMQGMVLMGGPLLVVLTNAHFNDRRYYRATLAALWLVINIILLIIFGFDSMLTQNNFFMVLSSVIPLFLAIMVGNRINKKLNNLRFNQLVNGLLIFSGITILIQAI